MIDRQATARAPAFKFYRDPKPGIVPQSYKAIPKVRDCPRGTTATLTESAACPCASWSRDWFVMPIDAHGDCAICGGSRRYSVEVSMNYVAGTVEQLALEAAPRPRAKRSPMPARTAAPAELDLVGPDEIAKRLGVKPQTVAVWKVRKRLPVPLAVISHVPVWHWATINQWATTTGRMQTV